MRTHRALFIDVHHSSFLHALSSIIIFICALAFATIFACMWNLLKPFAIQNHQKQWWMHCNQCSKTRCMDFYSLDFPGWVHWVRITQCSALQIKFVTTLKTHFKSFNFSIDTFSSFRIFYASSDAITFICEIFKVSPINRCKKYTILKLSCINIQQ